MVVPVAVTAGDLLPQELEPARVIIHEAVRVLVPRHAFQPFPSIPAGHIVRFAELNKVGGTIRQCD